MPGSELNVDRDTFCFVGHEVLRSWDKYMMGREFILVLVGFAGEE
jgi:hypothetical protein